MRPVVLCILDGFGLKDEIRGNALKQANTPNLDYLMSNYPNSKLIASGTSVGLTEGTMGNSEVGHMNIGSGRIVFQPIQLINNKIDDLSFFENETLLETINHVKKNNSKLHIFGLLSDGGVHSCMKHLFAVMDMVKKNNIAEVYYHFCTDGRDTSPNSALIFYKEFKEKQKLLNLGKVATVSGRYYGMDRDNRWDRIEKAYNALINGVGERYNSFEECIEANYHRDITDEFIIPAIIDGNGMIDNNDGIIVFNYRPDRLREIWQAVTNNEFNEFNTKKLTNIRLATMMPISNDAIYKNAFNLGKLDNTLGEYVSNLGIRQLRIAETEKYAHVTYFFDGGVEKDLKGCKRILIPSPKVATYDLSPDMSANEITDTLLSELANFDLVILNFANGDMLGHTGKIPETIKGIETVDYNLGKIMNKVNELNYLLVVTADHGNCEEMLTEDNEPITSHTTNLVPFIICDKNYELEDGKLADIAPTILKIMNIDIPKEMTGNILIKS